MKIQYASDLHLEFPDNDNYIRRNPLKRAGDILVIAGDIGYINDDSYCRNPFWDWASSNYCEVIVAVGNHELYNFVDLAKMPRGMVYAIRSNVRCYYDAVIKIGDVDLIVSTLWAKIPEIDAIPTQVGITDFYRIMYDAKPLTWDKFNLEHDRCFSFIESEVRKSSARNIVVVTHHVPSFQLSSPEFNDSRTNGAFTVELANFIENNRIYCWIYGHSHRNIDKIIANTHCLTNQLGYVQCGEHLSFNPEKIIEV